MQGVQRCAGVQVCKVCRVYEVCRGVRVSGVCGYVGCAGCAGVQMCGVHEVCEVCQHAPPPPPEGSSPRTEGVGRLQPSGQQCPARASRGAADPGPPSSPPLPLLTDTCPERLRRGWLAGEGQGATRARLGLSAPSSPGVSGGRRVPRAHTWEDGGAGAARGQQQGGQSRQDGRCRVRSKTHNQGQPGPLRVAEPPRSPRAPAGLQPPPQPPPQPLPLSDKD